MATWEEARAARKAAEEKQAATDRLASNIRSIIDGTIEVAEEDEEASLVQELATINHDHQRRGLFSSSVRWVDRRDAHRKHLRASLTRRVRTTVDAYETAGVPLPPDAAHQCVVGVLKAADAKRDRMREEVRSGRELSLVPHDLSQSLDRSIQDVVSRETRRAITLFETLRAAHEIRMSNRQTVVGPTSNSPSTYPTVPPFRPPVAGDGAGGKEGSRSNSNRPDARRRGGRPSESDPAADRRVFEAWRTRQHADLEALARAFGQTKPKIKLTLARHRTRTRRAARSGEQTPVNKPPAKKNRPR